MILILPQTGAEAAAQAIAVAIAQESALPSSPLVLQPGAVWSRNAEWDDLLLVVYNSKPLSASAVQFINAFQAAHPAGGTVIPIGVNPDFPIPPDPLSAVKAAKYDGTPALTALIVKAAGVFLGLALRPGSQKIFVSYRAIDGKQLAKELHDRLEAAGFKPWLDEAQENLVIGDQVQETIRANVDTAAMVLLVDTPQAPVSNWVSIEVDLANGQLIPVLPVVAGGEKVSRFVQLQGLRRFALVKMSGMDATPLNDAEWDGVHAEIDELLLSTFRRRLRILSRARAAFEGNGYQWQTVDEHLRMYRADKAGKISKTVALSHCLVQDITYPAALNAYWNYLKGYPGIAKVNQKLCIYDRDRILSEPERAALSGIVPDMSAILVHYNELEPLIAANFLL